MIQARRRIRISAIAFAIALFTANVDVEASAVNVTNVYPARWADAVPTNADFVAFLDAAPSFSSTSFVFNSSLRGRLNGSVSAVGNSLKFVPSVQLRPGEMIEGSLDATGLERNYSWRFSVAPEGGSATFVTNVSSAVTNSGGELSFRTVALGDMNGDGRCDLVVPSWGTSNVIVLTNNTGSIFLPVNASISTGEYYDVTLADVNCDLRMDAILAAAIPMIVVATNDGNGRLSFAREIPVPGLDGFMRRVSSGDLNGDGVPDVIVVSEILGQVAAMTNNGSGVFTETAVVDTGGVVYGMDAGDLNGDGLLDVAVVGTAGYLGVITNGGGGVLVLSEEYSVSAQTLRTCRIADFNHDGHADIAMAGGEGLIVIGYGGASGLAFTAVEQDLITTTINGLAVGDCDDNGWQDLVACGGEKTMALLSRDGTNFLATSEEIVLQGQNLRDAALADFSNDGNLDLAVCGFADGVVQVFWNSPKSLPDILGTNGQSIVSGEAAAAAKGTAFGTVPVLTSVTNAFRIVNRGAGVLQIGGAAISGVSTSIVSFIGLTNEVQPGATSQFYVAFSPTSFVPVSATMTISNNSPLAGSTSPYLVNFTGSGIKKPIAGLALEATNQTYDGTARIVMATSVPPVTVDISYAGASWPPTNVGTYTVTGTVNDAIYTGAVTGILTVAKRTLFVACADYSRGYGDANPAFDMTITNYAGGEDASNLSTAPTVACLATTNSHVNTYAITASGGAAANYAFQYTQGTLTITQAVLTVRADDQSREYGAANPPLSISYSGWKNSENTNSFITQVDATTTANPSSPMGKYEIVVSGGSATNYLMAYTNGLLTVLGAPATVAISNTNQYYDGSSKTVTVTTVPGALPVNVTYNGGAGAPVTAGVYSVWAGITDPNYNGTNTASMTIMKGNQAVSVFLPTGGMYASTAVMTLSATGTASGLPISFGIASGPGVMVDSNKFRFTGFGPVAVTATQAGGANWNASPPATNLYSAFDTNLVHYAAMAGQTSLWPHITWDTAASNIQDAVDATADGDSVLVADGAYTVGGRVEAGYALTNRVFITNRIVVSSVNGPSATFIVGRPGTGAEAPLGNDAVRCAFLTNGAVIAGFTLTNGGTKGASGDEFHERSGGGILQQGDCMASNCVVTGNRSGFGGGARGGALVWCTIANNTATLDGGGTHGSRLDNCRVAMNSADRGGGAFDGVLNDCLAWSNTANFGGGAFTGALFNCTVAANVAGQGGGVGKGSLKNCVVYGNQGGDVDGAAAEFSCASDGIVHGVSGNTTNQPLFVDAASLDFHVLHDSPCVNGGANVYAPTNGTGAALADIDGRTRIVHGTIDMGAYEYNATPSETRVTAATAIAEHGFTAVWIAPTSAVTVRTYSLEVTNALSGGTSIVALVSGSQTNAAVSGLLAGTAYNYRVRAENEYAVGNWSDWTNVLTRAEIFFANLSQTYDGAGKSVTVTTMPPALACSLAYNGNVALPVTAGTYSVYAEIDDLVYDGSNTASMTIMKASQVVSNFLPVTGSYASDTALTLSAQGTESGCPVSFAVAGGSGVMISSNQFRFSGLGTATVTAWKVAGDNWNASPAITNEYTAIDVSPVHYVARSGQTSIWPYITQETAVSNIQDAVNVAVAGDMVVVSAGWYSEGGQAAPGKALTNRLYIDKPILVRAVDGPSVTFIVGAAGTGADAPLGPDAVRCAYLTNNAILAGFTVTNGHTMDSSFGGGSALDFAGGGVMQFEGCVVSNCAIVGNAAQYGGGVFGGAVSRCVVAGNDAEIEGGGLSETLANNTVVAGNMAEYGGGTFRCTLYNSTITDNGGTIGGGAYEGVLRNSIAWYNTGGDTLGSAAYYTCAGSGVTPGVQGCITNAPLFADRFAGDYRLSYYSPCINAGLNADVQAGGIAGSDVDLAGTQRVIHVTVDMGAMEYDGIPWIPSVRPATAVQAYGFQANWTAPAAGADVISYRLELTNLVAGGAANQFVVGGSLTNAAMDSLYAGVDYSYRVRSENVFGNSEWTGWMNVTTLTDGAILVAPAMDFQAVYGSGDPAARAFVLTNGGQTAYAWTNTQYYGGNASGWLNVTPSSGAVQSLSTSILTASVSIAGLDAGVYVVTNVVSSPTATNSPVAQVVTLAVARGIDVVTFSATNQVYDGSPRIVGAVAAGGGSVAITYNGSSTVPTQAGDYAVTGIVDAVNWVATNTTVLRVAKASQDIAQIQPAGGQFLSTNVLALGATGGLSGNPVVFSVVSGPGRITGGNLRFIGFGDVQVTADQAGNANWLSASSVTNVYTAIPTPSLTHYVAQAGQTSVWPYASWADAASNIQDAVDAAWDGDQVLVARGIYGSGGQPAPGYSLTNRVCIRRPITVESVEGPEFTIIAGQSSSGGRFGEDAARCAYLTNGAVLTGFQLSGGWTRGAGGLPQDRSGGGALVLDGGIVTHCNIVTNRAYEYGGGAYIENGGELVTSIVSSNSTAMRGGGVCLFLGGIVRSCTVSDNSAAAYGGGVYLLAGGNVYNSIAWYNVAVTNGNDLFSMGGGSIVRDTCAADGITHGVDGCITNAPVFFDRAANDLHLQALSPCVDAGNDSFVSGALDMDGDSRIAGTATDMGADEYVAVPAAPAADPASGVTAHSFTAAWHAGNGMPVTNYVLAVFEMPAATVVFSNSVGTATNYSLSSLNPSTVYRYMVEGENAYGPGLWSGYATVTTLTEAAIYTAGLVDFTATYGGTDPAAKVATLTNAGETACAWTNTITYGGTGGWLGATPVAGNLQAGAGTNITLAVSISGLNAGTYVATNTVTSLTATNSPQLQVVTLTVNKADQAITFTNGGTFVVDEDVTLDATASSGLAVGYAVQGGPGVIAGNVLSFSGAGDVTVRASQAGNANYNAAASTDQVFHVQSQAAIGVGPDRSFTATYSGGNPANQGVTVTNGGETACAWTGTISYGSASGWLGATPVAGNLQAGAGTNVTLAVSISGLNAGTYYATNTVTSLTATNSPQLQVVTLTVNKADQAIAFTNNGAVSVSSTITLDATASSGLAVQYTVASGPAVLAGNVLSFTGLGDVAVRASQAGNHNYNPAAPVDAAFQVRTTVGDYDGFGSAEIVVYWPAGGMWHILPNQGNATIENWGWSAAIPVPGDYDGDGKTDTAVYWPAGGRWYILYSGGGTLIQDWGWSGAIPVPGDYDGDRKTDIAVYVPSEGAWYILNSGGGTLVQNWGWSAAMPVPGDYDGDGKTDIAVYVPSEGAWYILYSGGGALAQNWGWSAAMPVPGDYDGDGETDIAVYVPSEGKWYVLNSGGSVIIQNWGWQEAVPVAADYDGDGKTDMAVYWSGAGDWNILQSSGGVRTLKWGWSEAMPVLLQYQVNRWFGFVD